MAGAAFLEAAGVGVDSGARRCVVSSTTDSGLPFDGAAAAGAAPLPSAFASPVGGAGIGGKVRVEVC